MSQFEPLFPTTFNPAEFETPRPADFVDPGIIYPNLPTATKSFNKRYMPGNQFQRQLSTPVYNALKHYDSLRVQQGKAPITEERAAVMSTAAEQNRAVTPEPEKNFGQSISSDLTNLVTSIPRLPQQMLVEAQRLTNLPSEMSRIQQETRGDIGAQLGQYLQLPGINLVPGTYVASEAVQGNFGELLDHPLYTALDVLPYASRAAKGTRVAKAAEAEGRAAAAQKSATLGVPIAPKVPNPIKAVATQRLDASGNLVPNKFGTAINAGMDILGRTKPGEVIADTWGNRSRELSRAVADTNKQLREDFSPVGPATNDPTAIWVRQVNSLDQRHPNITPEDRLNITKSITNPVDAAGNPININDMGFNGEQLAYAYELKDLSDRSRILAKVNANTDELADRDWFGSPEVFTQKQAGKLDRFDKILTTYQDNLAMRQQAADRLRAYGDRNQPPTMTIGGIEVPNPYYTPQLDAVLDTIGPLRRTDPMVKTATDFMRNKQYGKAAQQLRKMYKSQKWQKVLGDPADFEAAMQKLVTMGDDQKLYNKLRGHTADNFANLQRRIETKRANVLPARYGEVAQSKLQEMMGEYVTRNFANDPLFNEFLAHVDNGNYQSLVSDSSMQLKEFYDIQKEANRTVAELKQAGVDPVFLHRVSPDSAKSTAFPAVLDKRVEPSSLKERTLDVSPYVPDLQIAMSHQGLEFLNRRYAEELVQRIDNTWGRDKSELRREYLADAHAAKLDNPLLDVNHYINERIRKDGWTEYDPEKFAPWRKGTGSVTEAQTVRMVPSAIKRNLDRMHKPPKVVAALDPILNVFRTSVLALSPRWLVNNVIGGAMLLLAETADPVRTIRFLREAKQMTSTGSLHAIPGMPEKGAFDISQEDIANLTNRLSDAEKLTAIRQHASGKWVKELWDDTQQQKVAGKIKNGFGAVVQKSYDLNTWFDDFYRSLAYLTGEDKALTKGMSKQAAEEAGIATARKVMQNWDEITPIERSVLRYIFPFYGFMQHIARYVMRYPIDHPWRTAILGSFARNEEADMGTGLPQRFLSMGFIGEQDEEGNQGAINLGGANPFGAVSDMYTLGGMLGSMNPLISSFAESLGLDPTTGTTSLYPGYTYNAETGRIEAGQANYFTTLAGNIFPLANTLNTTVFNNGEFQKLLKTNPEAAGRMIQAQTGLPILYRNVNVPTEIMKAESQRLEAQDKAKAEMLRTGNYDIANQYPGLNSYLQTIMEQQGSPEGLAPYQAPEMEVDNPIDALVASYMGQTNLPPINFQSR